MAALRIAFGSRAMRRAVVPAALAGASCGMAGLSRRFRIALTPLLGKQKRCRSTLAAVTI
jgi:hypothetical protein